MMNAPKILLLGGLACLPSHAALTLATSYSDGITTTTVPTDIVVNQGVNPVIQSYVTAGRIVRFRMDARAGQYDVRNGGGTGFMINGSYLQTGSFAAPSQTDLDFGSGNPATLINNFQVGANYVLIQPDTANLGGAAAVPVAVGIQFNDNNNDSLFGSGDTITFLGAVYDPDYDSGNPTASPIFDVDAVAAALSPVPEPSTGLLALSALALGLVRRRS